jgi:hypothetical protein
VSAAALLRAAEKALAAPAPQTSAR